MLRPLPSDKGQIALEFLIVYSFVLIVFILVFAVITTQRAATITQQEYSLLQLQNQNIASYIDQAVSAGSGYYATIPLVTGLVPNYYNLSISSTGVIISKVKIGAQPITTYAYSHAKNFFINGTLVQSGNGILIYQLQTARGSVSIANSKGIIYINQLPVATSLLPSSAVITQQANVKAVTFNDLQKVGLLVSASSTLTLRNVFSIVFWFNNKAPRASCDSIIGMGVTQLLIYEGSACFAGYQPNPQVLDFKYWDNVGVTHLLGSGLQQPGVWTQAAATFNGVSGTLNWYINGVNTGTYSGLTGMLADNNNLNIGGGATVFNGSVANLQIYNGILTSNQIMMNYNEGLGGTPVSGPNLLGYWPLNGNPNDYSGYNNHGTPLNGISFQSVVQLNAKVLSNGGNTISNVLVGFVSSKGSLSLNGLSYAAYTNGNGIASGFVTSNGNYGAGNVSIDVFNGNLSTTANLVGWWPLDTKYGNVAYDLSGNYNNGKFNNYNWANATNQSSFISAKFPGNPDNIAGSNTEDGFITINSSQSLLGIVANNSFTAVAWIYYKGSSPNHWQGIFGNLGGPGCPAAGGFVIITSSNTPSHAGTCDPIVGNAVFIINTSWVLFPPGLNGFPTNRWEMITAEYNGSTGLASVYVNSTLFASNVLPKNLGLLNLGQYYIGGDAWQATGYDTLNGLISNVQLYSKYLTKTQISTLYRNGITTNPLGNSGLISWWPLAGNYNDYSFNNNNGVDNVLASNVIFVSSIYSNNFTSIAQGSSFATFNGVGNIIIPYTPRIGVSNSFSIELWFLSTGDPTITYDDIMDATSPNGFTFDMRICVTSVCLLHGIYGAIGTGTTWLNRSVNYPFNLMPNTWYNVVETFNNTGWTIYLNGNKVSKGGYGGTSGSPEFIGPGDHISIGGDNTFPYHGSIADVQVYNSIITPQQAMQLYAQGLPPHYVMNISLG